MKKNKSTFTQREIAEIINNAIVYAKAPARLGPISEKRLIRLSEYTRALFEPLIEELEEEYLHPEEAVLICLAGALILQARVMNTDKVPTLDFAKTLKIS